MNTILLFVYMIGCLLVAWVLLKIFAAIIARNPAPKSQYERLEPIISTRQLERRDQRMEILENIIAAPKCQDGTLSDYQVYLWDRYHALEKENEQLSRQEYSLLARARR